MKLSVVIPVYNVAPYLRRCLDSIAAAIKCCEGRGIAQNEIEVICVDDCSTDGSSEILDEYAAKASYFVINHLKSNRGVSFARNDALKVARGEWVGFVDSDDAVAEEWFFNALKVLEKFPDADIVNFDALVSVVSPEDLSRAIRRAKCANVRILSCSKDVQARKKALYVFPRYGWSMRNFIRRDCLSGVQFPESLRLKEDIAFFLELSMHISKFVLADYPGYFYIRREGSAVARPRRDEDGILLAESLLALGRKYQSADLWRAITVALGYDFVQWAEERDPRLEYNPDSCPIRMNWRKLQAEGGDYLSAMYFWWRIGIRHWLTTGDIVWARRIRRVREWMAARFI